MSQVKHSPIPMIAQDAMVVGGISAGARGLKGLSGKIKLNQATKVLGNKDTFDPSKIRLALTNHVDNLDMYQFDGVKNTVIGIKKGAEPVFENFQAALKTGKEVLKTSTLKGMAKTFAIAAGLMAAFDIIGLIARKHAAKKAEQEMKDFKLAQQEKTINEYRAKELQEIKKKFGDITPEILEQAGLDYMPKAPF